MKKKISIGWVFVFLFILYLITNVMGDNTFEDFLQREKQIYADRDNHTAGWYGPEGKLDWDSSAVTNAGIYDKYSYTFIKTNNKKIEVSAIKVLGIWIDTTKGN